MKKLIILFGTLFIFLFIQSQTIQTNDTNWFRKGPYCAYVQSLSMAPSNSDIIYIGTYAAGIYKTINGGELWTYCSTENLPEWEDSLSNSISLPCWWYGDYYPIDDIAVDPQNPEHVWIGTLERGLLESTDGGNSWQKAQESLPDTLAINFIHINPQNPNDILLGTGKYFTVGSPQNGGLYRTMNGGNSWELIEVIPHGNTYNITDIKRDPTNNEHVIIGIGSAGEPGFSWGLMESYDNGNTWQEVMDVFPVHDISINPENNQNIWGVVYTGYMDFWLEFSEDGGYTWNLYQGFENPYLWVTSLYADADFNLYIERESEETIGTEIKKSTDNGISWFTLDNFPGVGGIGFENRFEADNTNTDNIFFSTYYGIYHSEDGGISTQLENTGLMNSYIYELEVHPINSEIVYAGGKQGLWKSIDCCHNWQQIMDKSIKHIKYNPTYPDTLYLGGGKMLLRSFNGGSTFENIYNDINGGIAAISINPRHTNIVFVSTGVDDNVFPIYKSTDYGDTWSHVFTSFNYEAFTQILIDTFHPDTIYFGRHRSLDGGLTWQENALELRIDEIHPQNSNILFGSNLHGNDIQISYDWGNSFQLMDEYLNGPFPGQNIRKFTIAKDNPDYLFYCTLNDGIHYSNNSGNNWQKLEGIYENRSLEIIPLINENKFYIATHGDGVWVYDTTYITILPEKEKEDDKMIHIYPNPFSHQLHINYQLFEKAIVNIDILNISGKLITTLTNKTQLQGKYEEIWNGKDKNGNKVNSGLYLIRLQLGGKVYTQKLLFVK